jgi:hypothetical protein
MNTVMTAPITCGKLSLFSEVLLATWKLSQNEDDRVTLLYYPGRQATPQHCGSGDAVLLRDVLAWCIDSAAVADVIVVEDAVFARLPAPGAVHGRVLLA